MRWVPLAFACTIAGCAAGRPDLSRPIDSEQRWYFYSYKQDGESIGRCRLALALYQSPEGRDLVWSAGTYAMNGVVFLGDPVNTGMFGRYLSPMEETKPRRSMRRREPRPN